jgi:hypothetical protein
MSFVFMVFRVEYAAASAGMELRDGEPLDRWEDHGETAPGNETAEEPQGWISASLAKTCPPAAVRRKTSAPGKFRELPSKTQTPGNS